MFNNSERSQGLPLSSEERKQRHYAETGKWDEDISLQGSGLKSFTYAAPTWLKSNWKWVAGTGGALILYIILIKKGKGVK